MRYGMSKKLVYGSVFVTLLAVISLTAFFPVTETSSLPNVNLSGPSSIEMHNAYPCNACAQYNTYYTWYASVSGGSPPYTYQWYIVAGGSSSPIGGNSSSMSLYSCAQGMPSPITVKVRVTDSQMQVVEKGKQVTLTYIC